MFTITIDIKQPVKNPNTLERAQYSLQRVFKKSSVLTLTITVKESHILSKDPHIHPENFQKSPVLSQKSSHSALIYIHTLAQTATRGNKLKTHGNTWQHMATHGNTRQHAHTDETWQT